MHDLGAPCHLDYGALALCTTRIKNNRIPQRPINEIREFNSSLPLKKARTAEEHDCEVESIFADLQVGFDQVSDIFVRHTAQIRCYPSGSFEASEEG